MPKYCLSQKSLKNLEYVHEDLCLIVHRAIDLTDVDFAITEGLRTVTRQKELYKAGASRTMNSRHLSGHAIDFVPIIGGQAAWKPSACSAVIEAFKLAAIEYKTPIVWGAVWDRTINGFSKTCDEEVADYTIRCRHGKMKPFLDYVHVELPREIYP